MADGPQHISNPLANVVERIPDPVTFDHITDLEVRREAERIRHGELLRRDSDLRQRQRAARTCVPAIGEPYRVSPPEEIERAAYKVIEDRRAWRKTPHGRFVMALNDARTAIDLAAQAEHEGRAAQSRDFVGERAHCEKWAGALMDAAKRLRSAALDAELAAMGNDLTEADEASLETLKPMLEVVRS